MRIAERVLVEIKIYIINKSSAITQRVLKDWNKEDAKSGVEWATH